MSRHRRKFGGNLKKWHMMRRRTKLERLKEYNDEIMQNASTLFLLLLIVDFIEYFKW